MGEQKKEGDQSHDASRQIDETNPQYDKKPEIVRQKEIDSRFDEKPQEESVQSDEEQEEGGGGMGT